MVPEQRPNHRIAVQPRREEKPDGSVNWSLVENNSMTQEGMPIVTFQYNRSKDNDFKNGDTTAHCGFHIHPDMNHYFEWNQRKVLFSLIRDRVFPKIMEDLRAMKGEMLETINFYSTTLDSYRQLNLLQKAIERAGKHSHKNRKGYEGCPFSSVTVTLTP